MTLHGAKGLEFPRVHIAGVVQRLLPMATLGVGLEEERRLMYVGITRTKDTCTLYHR